MWNPNSYRDSDYGLSNDERFEPTDKLDDDFAPREGEPFIQTVLGPIAPDEAGVALVREYLQWRPGGLADVQAALTDLEAFFTASGRTIVSATAPDAGRDAHVLLTLAQHAPLHIIGGTGWSIVPSSEFNSRSIEEGIERDITDGMDDTPARPGLVVGSIGADMPPNVVGDALGLLASAQRRFGLPVMVDCGGRDNLKRVLESKLDVEGLIVTGDVVRTQDSAIRIAEGGAFVLVSPLEGINAERDRQAARLVTALVDRGWQHRVLVSHAFTDRSRLNGYGGRPGLSYLVEQFAVMLLESGMHAHDVQQIVIDNAALALSVRGAQQSA
ncbi:MAG TPA: hypothetical protein VGR22_07040 [Thermomicrobiales bacterium]|nr:hypothetical protein [Thermomicrobiales bacterium]